MTTKNILLHGDGIGPKVVGEAKRVLEWAGVSFAFDSALLGSSANDAVGTPCPAETLEKKDAIATYETRLKAERPWMAS